MKQIVKHNEDTLHTSELVQFMNANKSIIGKACNGEGRLDYGVVLRVPTVIKLIEKIGVENVQTIIKGSLMLLNAKLNIKHKMDDLQIALFINDLLDECKDKDYRLEELVYFFNEVTKSTYGKIYERMDGALLFEFLGEYEKQSAKAIEGYFRVMNEQVTINNNIKEETFVMSEASKKILEDAKKRLIEKNKKPFYKPFNNGLKELSSNVKNYIEQDKERKMIKEILAWDGQVIDH